VARENGPTIKITWPEGWFPWCIMCVYGRVRYAGMRSEGYVGG